jgi:hypothetical protein
VTYFGILTYILHIVLLYDSYIVICDYMCIFYHILTFTPSNIIPKTGSLGDRGPVGHTCGEEEMTENRQKPSAGNKTGLTSPIGSIYGIYANIWGILIVNVTIFSIHGSYGSLNLLFKISQLLYDLGNTKGRPRWRVKSLPNDEWMTMERDALAVTCCEHIGSPT